jgi:glycosyltransferase involved in cell wall biosynthesis
MIYHHIPWNKNKCIGTAYNEILALYKDEDWVTVMDADAMHTTNEWYKELEEAIAKYPNAMGFGCRSNRLRTIQQTVIGVDIDNHDIFYHRKIGGWLANKFKNHVTPHFNKDQAGQFTGLWFAFNVGFMRKIGGFYVSGNQQSTDNIFHKNIVDAGKEFYILDAVYVYHWYRADSEYDHYTQTRKYLEKFFCDNFKITKNVKHIKVDENNSSFDFEIL